MHFLFLNNYFYNIDILKYRIFMLFLETPQYRPPTQGYYPMTPAPPGYNKPPPPMARPGAPGQFNNFYIFILF